MECRVWGGEQGDFESMIFEATPAAKMKHGIKAGRVCSHVGRGDGTIPLPCAAILVKYPHIKTHVEALVGQVRSCSRHAGGVLIADDLNEHMPIISSGGVRQSPWAEGSARSTPWSHSGLSSLICWDSQHFG